jgi:hypothetical protein
MEASISTRIELPANFDNRVIEMESNTVVLSPVHLLEGELNISRILALLFITVSTSRTNSEAESAAS